MNQLRYYTGSQIRVDPKSDGRKLIGLAIPYNSLSRNLGGFVERFTRGSVSKSVANGQIVALLNHEITQPLGTQQAGTLRLNDGNDGLHVEIELPDTTYARDAIAMISRGDGTGMSFGFRPNDIAWTKENGMNVAEVRDAELGEVSVLTGAPPAYEATHVALRSLKAQGEIDYAERYGIDLEKLSGVFVAIKKGLPLEAAEREILEQARCLFQKVRKPALEAAIAKAERMLID